MSTTNHTTLWLVDGQSVCCIKGKPFAQPLDTAKTNDLLNDDNIVALGRDYPSTYVCDKVVAQRLGILPDSHEFIPYRQLVGTLDDKLNGVLARCLGLMYWHNSHRFCGACGTPTAHDHDNVMKICPNCQLHSYPKLQPCIITAILRFDDNNPKPQILLAKHHRHATLYTLIAGFVEVGESLEQCVAREVYEEVGLMVENLTFVGSQAWPYPSNLMVGFVCRYASGDIRIQEEELADARFFALDDLPALPPLGSIARRIIEDIRLRYV